VSLPGKRLSLLRHFCGLPKSLQVNSVLVRKIKLRPIKSKDFKLACDLVRMSHQSSSDQTPASYGSSPGSVTAQSLWDLRCYRSNYGSFFYKQCGFPLSINILQMFRTEIRQGAGISRSNHESVIPHYYTRLQYQGNQSHPTATIGCSTRGLIPTHRYKSPSY